MLLVLAIIKLSAATESAAHDDYPLVTRRGRVPILRAATHRNLRRLEDAGGNEDNGEDDTDDNTIMNIEQDVETALTDMFYTAPSEWTGKHWAFFAGIVTTVCIVLGLFAACVISCCCSRGGGKPVVVRTQEELDRCTDYTDALMRDPVSNNTEDDLDQGRHYRDGTGDEDSECYSGKRSEDYDSGFYSTEDDSSFDDEYIRKRLHRDSSRSSKKRKPKSQKSQSSDFEFTTSHVDYNGPNRRQLC